jgi:hypothetical protein
MQVVLDKGFVERLIELNRADERKAAHVAVRKFSQNPSNPGLSLERLRDVRDRNLWSMRVSRDVRIILYRGREAWLMLYVAHHDDAYRWAERVKVERHPITGGLQIVHTEDVYREEVLEHSPAEIEDEPLYAAHSEERLLSLGVPEEALPSIMLLAPFLGVPRGVCARGFLPRAEARYPLGSRLLIRGQTSRRRPSPVVCHRVKLRAIQ